MKPFKLQVVLEHRQRLEDQARQALATAIQHELQARKDYDSHVAELAELTQEYEQRQLQGMHAHEFVLYENQLHYKRQALTSLEAKIAAAQKQVELCRKALGDAGREKKLLEKLKEKKELEQKQEMQRREMAQLDEVAIMFRDEDEK